MQHQAAYTQGSVFKHVTTLSLTWAVGLLAIFVVDLVDLFFIAMLGKAELAAAVGFAGVGLFIGSSVCFGVSISIGTLVAQSLGEDNDAAAQRLVSHGLLYMLLWAVPVTMITVVYAPELLALLGAQGETLDLAVMYFRIVGISLPVLALAIGGTAILRSAGDSRRAMWSTLLGGIVNAIFDPLLIFGLGLELQGAAIASVLSRVTVAAVAVTGLLYKHQLISKPDLKELRRDFRDLTRIAIPSVISNLSGPIGSSYATMQMAKFGTDAVAAASVIGRVTPVAFAGLYGLSGAIAPVASQNVGAGKYHRVKETLIAAVKFILVYVIPVALLLFLVQNQLVSLFDLEGESAELLRFYATFIVSSYLLFALQLSATPIFTALHHPGLGTASNFARDLILMIPLIALFASLFGAKGVLAGQALANAIAGVLTFWAAWWLIRKVEDGWDMNLPIIKLNCSLHRALAPGVQHRGW